MGMKLTSISTMPGCIRVEVTGTRKDYIVVRAHEKRGNLLDSIVHKPAIHYILHVQYNISK